MIPIIAKYKNQIALFLLTSATYIYFSNFFTAAVIIISISFHEYSHLVAARHLNLNTKGFYLIPFVGGVSIISDRFVTLSQKVFIALAGPIGGTILASLLAITYHFTESRLLAQAALIMVCFNFFNLLPLSFLDGGQVIDSILVSINERLGLLWRFISTVLGAIIVWNINKLIAVIIIIFTLPQATIAALAAINNQTSGLVVSSKLDKRSILITLSLYISTILYILLLIYYLIAVANISNILNL